MVFLLENMASLLKVRGNWKDTHFNTAEGKGGNALRLRAVMLIKQSIKQKVENFRAMCVQCSNVKE